MRRNVYISIAAVFGGFLFVASSDLAAESAAQAPQWQAAARWHRSLKKSVPGVLVLDNDGVKFRSAKLSRQWSYVEIHSFDLSVRELTLLTYERRPWHEPGERPFHFTLDEPMPPVVAAQFAERVGKPVRNGNPAPSATAIAEIPAHHRTWSGGSNGTLRLREEGIDYFTESGRDSRSWRWSDIQTIANPNPYELRVATFRDIVEFDLKQPISRDVFERVWDRLYAPGLDFSAASREKVQR